MFNTHCRCFVIFFLSHFYRYICHSLSRSVEASAANEKSRRKKRHERNREQERPSEPWTQFIHFSFSLVRFFTRIFSHCVSFALSCEWLHVHRSRWCLSCKRRVRRRKKTRPSEKCEPINCVFSLFCILLYAAFFWFAIVVLRFMVFSFCALKKYCIGLCPD